MDPAPPFAVFESLFSPGWLPVGGHQIFFKNSDCSQSARGLYLVPPFHRHVASDKSLKVSKSHVLHLKKAVIGVLAAEDHCEYSGS